MKRIPLITSLYNDRHAIFELARKDVKTQYRGSILGYVWTVLHPLLNMLVMWLVFRHMFGRNDPYYPIYLLTGNILFTALRTSTEQALASIVLNRGLLLRTKMNASLFPVSKSVASMTNFFYSLIALIPFMIYLSFQQGINLFTYRLLFIFLLLPAFWLFELGLGFFLSAVYVFFRDVKHIYSVFLTLWMYLTPIFYKTEIMDGFSLTLIKLNPMYHFLSYFRDCVYMGATAVNAEGVLSPVLPNFVSLGICYLCGVVALIIGGCIYKLCKKNIILNI